MRVFVGLICHSISQTELALQRSLLGVNDHGKIEFVHPCSTQEQEQNLRKEVKAKYNVSDEAFITLTKRKFLIPGFVDTHIHAPQYVFTGTGYDRPLLQWLETYTFPRESDFKDLKYAQDSYTKVVRRLLKCGTTTAAYFATIHKSASNLLADITEKLGQRAFIGKVNMDRNSPSFYTEASCSQSLQDTVSFIDYVLKKNTPLVQPIVTPRFAISCTPELMSGLGDLAAKHNLLIQTHVSENLDEISFVKELHPESEDYIDVYDKAGLITNRTLLAHSIYLSDRELQVIKTRGAGISHCAASNFCLRSGVLHVRRLLDKGIKVGLGTDVSGGPQPSMLDAIRQSKTASNVYGVKNPKDAITTAEAFYLATLGGAHVLNLESVIGNFVPGKDFDALVVNVEDGNGQVDIFPHDTPVDMFEKFIHLGDDRNIEAVYVQGKLLLKESA
jgi:guanine deaminase